MQLSLQDFTSLVRIQAAAVGSSARTLIDLSVGSVLRALLEANASVGLWIQWLILEVLSTTRAATSLGEDLDSWVADFGMQRLPSIAALGYVRFGRDTTTMAAIVPVGAIVRTGVTPDAQTFTVTASPQQPFWNGSGYTIAASVESIVVPVQAVAPGRAGNVQAGVLTLLSTAVPGVDSVVNDSPASGGLDAETDLALRLRFNDFIDSRTRATEQAIRFAIQSVQQGLQFSITERLDTAGMPRAGHFTIVVDDGSGAPGNALLTEVGAAVELTRAIGSTYSVIAPRLLQANLTLQAAGCANPAAVEAAVGAYVAGLGIGRTLALSKVVQLAHEADSTISTIRLVTVNGNQGDLVPSIFGRIIPGIVTVLS